jgi:hypothetical protein
VTALYYCSDADLTDQLPDDLTDSPIDTSAKRDIKLRAAGRAWVDSMYPGIAPFAQIGGQTVDWLVNQADHAAGDTTVTIDGGTGDPAVGDWFRIELQNTWYRISAYASNVITYASRPPDWLGSGYAAFPDNARIELGTPNLLRTAAIFYAVGVGILILRRNPEDKMAAAAFAMADKTLGVKDGVASREPWPFTDWADDAGISPPVFTSGEATLER